LSHPRLDHTFFENEVRPHLGAALLNLKLVRPEQLDQALAMQRETGKRLGQLLVDLGWVYEQDISRAIALQNDLSYIDLEASSVDPRAASKLNPEVGQRLCAIPVRFEGDRLLVAVDDPFPGLSQTIRSETGSESNLCIGDRSVILNAWRRLLRGHRP
jgi:type IV pilus assembly protein PilB